MKSSTKDKAEGKMHQAKGKIKETGGGAVGNKDLEAEGKVENIKGKAQEKAGDVKEVGGKQRGSSRFQAQLGNEKIRIFRIGNR